MAAISGVSKNLVKGMRLLQVSGAAASCFFFFFLSSVFLQKKYYK